MDFGIDFGTTNSACTGIQDSRIVHKYTDRYGGPFPSIVIIDRVTGKVYCGREAWTKKEELRESCEVITSIKSYLGTGKIFSVGGKNWTPEMVAAEIFLGLKELIKERAVDLKEAVVAVPVGFLPEKRVALRKAAEMAAINIKTFVSEPTAALFGNYSAAGNFEKIAVFDWGGGTLDVSVIENRGGMIKELATGGLDLAGDHIDRKLAKWAHMKLLKEGKLISDFESMPPSARDKMIARCEEAKRDLTLEDVVAIRFLDYGELETVNISIDIDTFSSLVEPEVNMAVDCFNDTLGRAKVSFDEIGCILMVGGSVNLRPMEIKALDCWKDKVLFPSESAWTVSNGAAQLSADPGHYVTSQRIGVTMSEGTLYPLIKEGARVDTFRTEARFALVEDSDTANIVISDGNGNFIDVIDVPATGFLKEKICLEAAVDTNLIFNIIARSTDRGSEYEHLWQYPGITLNYKLPALIKANAG